MKAERVDLGNVKGDKGEKGEQGVGIKEIYKTETEGYDNTYRIVLTNDEYYEIVVKDGTNVTTLDHLDSASTHPVRSSTLYTEINKKINNTEKGAPNGVATLDNNRKIPNNQLPSYVDDVIEGYYYNSSFYTDNTHETIITPESDKIYVDISNSQCYRWGGSQYVIISTTLTLGTTSNTAFYGDRGLALEESIDELSDTLSSHRQHYYGICSTREGTNPKIVESNAHTLEEGDIITVFFTNGCEGGTITLLIDILGYVECPRSNTNNTKDMVTFVYDGSKFKAIDDAIATTSTVGLTRLENSLTNNTDCAVTPKAVKDEIGRLESLIEDINDYINQ